VRVALPADAPVRLLAVCGSLRSASVNAALLRAASRLAPHGVEVLPCPGLGELPLFNPDLDAAPSAAVQAFRARVKQADALLIASPEYAHGMTGTLKNALDWLVSCEPFADKLVAVLNASPRAHHADAALREVLTTMAASIVEPASVGISLVGAGLDDDGMVSTPAVAEAIQSALVALAGAVRARRAAHTEAVAPSHPL
jgi:chromate reductase